MNYPAPPLWGNFVGAADEDVISACILHNYGRFSALYSAHQAVEKYLKAIVLSLQDRKGRDRGLYNKYVTNRGFQKHNLSFFHSEINKIENGFIGENMLEKLNDIDKYWILFRYPEGRQKFPGSRGFQDWSKFEFLFEVLRTKIPMIIDDYALGMVIRLRHTDCDDSHGSDPSPKDMFAHQACMAALSNARKLVHWRRAET